MRLPCGQREVPRVARWNGEPSQETQGELYCRVDVCIRIQISISLETIVSRDFCSIEKGDVDSWREEVSASVEKTNEPALGESLSQVAAPCQHVYLGNYFSDPFSCPRRDAFPRSYALPGLENSNC